MQFILHPIISLRGEALNKPPTFIEVVVSSQEKEWSCIYLLGVSISPLSTISQLVYGTVQTVWYLFIFILFYQDNIIIQCPTMKNINKYTCYKINLVKCRQRDMSQGISVSILIDNTKCSSMTLGIVM